MLQPGKGFLLAFAMGLAGTTVLSVAFGWSRAVLVENFSVLLGCAFPVPWLGTSSSGAFFVSLLAFLGRQLPQPPVWDMRPKKTQGSDQLSFLGSCCPQPVCLLSAFQSLLMFVLCLMPRDSSCPWREAQAEVGLCILSRTQKSAWFLRSIPFPAWSRELVCVTCRRPCVSHVSIRWGPVSTGPGGRERRRPARRASLLRDIREWEHRW